MSCPAIELLTEIRDRLRNLDMLEEMREKARLRMRAKRAAQENVREHVVVRAQKESEKGKETFPPAPPIEKRAKGKEKILSNARARARFVPPTIGGMRLREMRKQGTGKMRERGMGKMRERGMGKRSPDRFYKTTPWTFSADRGLAKGWEVW